MSEQIFDFVRHLERQRQFSERTFGPGRRTQGVSDHIRKELDEIARDPDDALEWIDVVILGLDGAWRAGLSPEDIIAAIEAKQAKNERRAWPDWRTADPNRAIEHDRSVGDEREQQNVGYYRTDRKALPACNVLAPPEWTAHWREWHRGHGCHLDPDAIKSSKTADRKALATRLKELRDRKAKSTNLIEATRSYALMLSEMRINLDAIIEALEGQ
jgi:hypothetical protein